ncbi:hypothetical protein ACIJYB_00025 [Candidatus Pelagibacter bacterium nBUS_44]
MIKRISFIFMICCLLVSCGKKSDPEYKDPKQKTEKIIILKNKA